MYYQKNKIRDMFDSDIEGICIPVKKELIAIEEKIIEDEVFNKKNEVLDRLNRLRKAKCKRHLKKIEFFKLFKN